jgi:hypothetical protein
VKTRSAKAKGRRLQQKVRDDLRAFGSWLGLQPEDIESRGMGQSGTDIIFSPRALEVWQLAVECKNVEKLNVGQAFCKHYAAHGTSGPLAILVHARNRAEALATLRWSDLLDLLVKNIAPQRATT